MPSQTFYINKPIVNTVDRVYRQTSDTMFDELVAKGTEMNEELPTISVKELYESEVIFFIKKMFYKENYQSKFDDEPRNVCFTIIETVDGERFMTCIRQSVLLKKIAMVIEKNIDCTDSPVKIIKKKGAKSEYYDFKDYVADTE